MSTTYISAELRRMVARRANGICEYCLIHEDDTFLGCHVDHIISEKHGGATLLENLAHACAFCNLHKGSDIASLIQDGTLSRFFNPRADTWSEHFTLSGLYIIPKTVIGVVTERIFEFNVEERVSERQALVESGRFPTEAAQRYIEGPDSLRNSDGR